MSVIASILILPVTEKLILYECNCSYILILPVTEKLILKDCYCGYIDTTCY